MTDTEVAAILGAGGAMAGGAKALHARKHKKHQSTVDRLFDGASAERKAQELHHLKRRPGRLRRWLRRKK